MTKSQKKRKEERMKEKQFLELEIEGLNDLKKHHRHQGEIAEEVLDAKLDAIDIMLRRIECRLDRVARAEADESVEVFNG